MLSDPNAVATVNQAIAAIGGEAIPANILAASCSPPDFGPPDPNVCPGITVIGVPGMPAGAADASWGINTGVPGRLTGWLQEDSQGNMTFVSGDYVPFDTVAPGTSATQAVITVGGQTYPLPEPFFVLATQNPIEQEGTYPLPEAQLDRFIFQINIGYPSYNEEKLIVDQSTLALK